MDNLTDEQKAALILGGATQASGQYLKWVEPITAKSLSEILGPAMDLATIVQYLSGKENKGDASL